jgi:hypothetical protein
MRLAKMGAGKKLPASNNAVKFLANTLHPGIDFHVSKPIGGTICVWMLLLKTMIKLKKKSKSAFNLSISLLEY